MSTPLNFLQASVRADELVANQKMGIGTSGQSSELHIKADAPEIRLEDKVGAADSETTTRIYADSGNTYIQSGVNFDDGSSSNIVFGSMGNETEYVNIGAHGIETTGNLFVNNLQFTQTQGLDQILNVSNTTSNIMTLTNTTASTSTTTGALTVAGGVGIAGDLNIGGETILGTAIYRKRRDWDRSALAYVYLGNVRTNDTTGIRLDVSLNNANTGYTMYQFQITLSGNDSDHSGGQLVYSAQGTKNASILRSIEIGYVYVGTGGTYEYQLWLEDPITSTTGGMDAYLNCQGYYNFDTGVSDVAHGGSAPTNFNSGIVGVLVDAFGNVGIGTDDPRATLDINSTDSVIIPSGTDAQRNGTPVNGMLRLSITQRVIEYYYGKWFQLSPRTGTSIVSNGLVVQLDASDYNSYSGTGTTWNDISGNGRNGTLRGSVSWTNDGDASYFDFPGANADYIDQTSGSAQIYKDICIVFKVDVDVNPTSEYLISKSTTADKSLRVSSSAIRNPGDGNDWSDSNSNGITYYVNGVADTGDVSISDEQWYILGGENTNDILLGSAWNYYLGTGYGGRHLNGKIAFVALYNRVLTATEQLQNYNALKARFGV
jgi:hypothetical protein